MDITPKYSSLPAEKEILLPPTLADASAGTSMQPDQSAVARPTISNRNIVVNPGDNLQQTITNLSDAGGGVVLLGPGTYSLTGNIVVPSDVTLTGSGSNTTILDFGNAAFQLQIIGSNGYTTGTVSISFGGMNVVGLGTTFTAAMVGRSILLQDFWYTISAYHSATSIDISTTYGGSTLSGSRYAIATTVTNVHLNAMTIQNSSVSLIKAQYVSNLNYTDLYTFGGNVGFDHAYVASINASVVVADTCVTGWLLNDVFFATFFNFNALNCTGNGVTANYFRNSAFDVFAIQNNAAVGMSLQNMSNVGLANYSVQANGTIGIELVANNTANSFVDGIVLSCGTDGVKFTATSDETQIIATSIKNNGGYGINIAASSCDNNIIGLNYFASNSSGNVTDSGTTTKIRSNIGVADN